MVIHFELNDHSVILHFKMTFNETIFLTGFPGFIAERLVAALAKPETQFFLLVQKAFVEKATTQIAKISMETETPLENFAVIEGDITQGNLGISVEDLLTVRNETTLVYHLAAIYDLAVEKNSAFRVNVEGTKNVNNLVKTIKNLKRYNYISTCYVAGKRQGVIQENELEHQAGFRNYYEETKYLAEIEVENLKAQVPTTIFRPSVVVGDSQTGETAKYDGIYYVIKYLQKFPSVLRLVNVGNKSVKLNHVPVDFVVNGIAALSKDEKAVGKTIALADPNPISTAEICDAVSEALINKKSVIVPPMSLVEFSLSLPMSPMISGLPHSGVPYFFLSQTYDTGVSEKLLAEHGITCPTFPTYIRNLIKYMEKHPKL